MPSETTVSWPDLVAEAIRDPRRISAIFEALDPILEKLGAQVASRLPDDAVQAARIAIWRALPKVDLSRSGSIRAMLLRAAYFAMRDEVRREMRRSRLPAEVARSEVAADGPPVADFTGILGIYAAYVRENGAFAGAHKHVASRLGVSMAKATSDFHRAAREFVRHEGLHGRPQRYAEIIEDVLSGPSPGDMAPGPDQTEAALCLARR